MNKQALSLAVFVAGAYPVMSNALSLGDIQSNSNLNQPLRAKIELLSTNVQEAKQLQVRLAPPSVFNRVGIDRPAYLDRLKFSPTIQNGKPIIMVTSDVPIQEPFVNFLVEVSWPQGQLLKEYTVMLDPPILMQAGSTVTNEAAVRAEPTAVGSVSRPRAPVPQQPRQVVERPAPRQLPRNVQPQRQAVQAQVARPAPRATEAPQQARRTYRVKSGDTLNGIARRINQRGVTVDQMMMALYRANPEAFIRENINGLKSGALLQSPSMNIVRALSSNQAREQVKQQHQEWTAFRSKLATNTTPQRKVEKTNSKNETTNNQASNAVPSRQNIAANKDNKARLEVLGSEVANTPANQAAAAAGKERLQALEQQLLLARESLVARQRENDDLKSRIDSLTSQLSSKNRILAMRDNQLAELQEKLAGQSATNGAVNTNNVPRINPASPPNSTGSSIPSVANGNTQTQQASLQQNNPTLPTNPSAVGDDIRNVAGQQNNTIVRSAQMEVQQSTPKPLVEPVTVNPNPIITETAANPASLSPIKNEPQEENELLAMLTSPLALKIGAGALGSLLVLGLLSRLLGRRRRSNDDSKDDMDAIFNIEDESDVNNARANIKGADVFANLEDDIKRAETNQQSVDLLDQDHYEDDSAWGDDGDPLKVSASNSTKSNGLEDEEEDDVLMESNVYIAYGLHQQAESELKKAIEKYPERLEYRHKLLENYFTANNREAFDLAAQEFEVNGGRSHGKLWEDVLNWGKKISPDNMLYQVSVAKSETNVTSLAAGAVAANALSDDDDEALLQESLTRELENIEGVSRNKSNTASGAGRNSHDELASSDNSLNELDLDLDLDISTDNVVQKTVASANDPLLDELDFDIDELAKPIEPNKAKVSDALSNELDELDFDIDELVNTKTAKPNKAKASSALASELDEFDFDIDELVNAKTTKPNKAKAGDALASELDELDFDALLAEDDTNDLLDKVDNGLDTVGAKLANVGNAVTDKAKSTAEAVGEKTSDLGEALANKAQQASNTVGNGLVDLGSKTTRTAKDVADSTDNLLDGLLDMADNVGEKVKDNAGAVVASAATATSMVASKVADKAKAVDDALTPDENDFDLNDLLADDDLDLDAAPEPLAPEPIKKAKKVTDLELHIKDQDLNKVLPEDNFYTKSSAATIREDTPDEEWLGDIDDALSFLDLPDEEIDLHEAHISTKLDLARAYLDMGDVEGARSTLEEVMVEGNDDQRREAESLLHQTG